MGIPLIQLMNLLRKRSSANDEVISTMRYDDMPPSSARGRYIIMRSRIINVIRSGEYDKGRII